MTADGKIATRTGKSQWITCEASRRHVHETRNGDDESIEDNFQINAIMRFRARTDFALTGRNGDRIPREQQLRICAYVHCTKQFLNTESCIEFTPVDSPSDESEKAEDSVLFEILNNMDKNAETNHFRVIQIQLSRIVLANLARRGFGRETFRRIYFV